MKQRLLSRKICATLVIGVRTRPFYSHAWVEVNNTVISDDPDLRKKTSVILEC
ncbi:lasso peptide biosynthesis B2 protein [Escherichia coli]|uniref:lasso peptide biosynthesis B2 protein n=1 Tax=Escherichia coli TaxID=562 RepID=UPI003B9D74DE